jgi:CHAT domain-containing protein
MAAEDPTLDLLCDQLVLHLQGELKGRINDTYRLLARRVLERLPEPAAERARKAPGEERALLAEALENLLQSDPRTRQLVSVILTPPGQTTRGPGHRQDNRVRVLILTAQPGSLGPGLSSLPRLQLDQEVRQIQAAIRRGPFGREFEVVTLPAARTQDLSWGLLEHEPEILHFSGHGDQGAIYVERPDGTAWPITGEMLARLFRIFKGGRLRCVVLNACETGGEAEPIAQEVGAAVVRPDKVPDQAALIFAEHFYQGLGYGRTLQDAFDLGCWQVEADGEWGESAKPQLLGEAREIRFAS